MKKFIPLFVIVLSLFMVTVAHAQDLLCPGGVCPTPTGEKATWTAIVTTEVPATATEQATSTQEQKPTETPLPTITSTSVVWTPPPEVSPTIAPQITPEGGHPNKPKQPKPQELPGLGCTGENCRPKQEGIDWSDPKVGKVGLIVFMIGLVVFAALAYAQIKQIK